MATVGKLEAGEGDAFPKEILDGKRKKNNQKKEAGEGVELLTVLDSTHIPDSHLACSGHT